MVTHILDTSAWLAHLFEEPGADQISELFKQNDNQVGVSVASLVEAYARLRAVGRAAEFEWAVDRYRQLFHSFVPVTESIALQAVSLRSMATSRLLAIDSIIAATAAQHSALLVHRDPHFLAIPNDLLKQEMLAAEE